MAVSSRLIAPPSSLRQGLVSPRNDARRFRIMGPTLLFRSAKKIHNWKYHKYHMRKITMQYGFIKVISPLEKIIGFTPHMCELSVVIFEFFANWPSCYDGGAPQESWSRLRFSRRCGLYQGIKEPAHLTHREYRLLVIHSGLKPVFG
jgi:hypothetical protein